MAGALRIPELARRDRFIKRVVAEGGVHVGVTASDIVSVASPRVRGRRVALLWSSRADAERWTPVVEDGAAVEAVSLGVLAGEIVGVLGERRMLVGLDWNIDPLEVELTPADLLERLQLEAVEAFVHGLRTTRTVWVLEDADGPAVMPSNIDAAHVLLPVWTDRAAAERHIGGDWSEAVALEIPLDRFVSMTLPWLAEQGWRLAPTPWEGGFGPEIGPAEIGHRLSALLAAA